MLSSRCEELEEKLLSKQLDLVQLSLQRKKFERTLKAQRAAAKKKLDSVQQVSLLLLAWSAPDMRPMERYLETASLESLGYSQQQMADDIIDKYLASSIEDIMLMMVHADQCMPPNALRIAQRFWQEHAVTAWIAKHNRVQGVAATVLQVIARRRSLSLSLSPTDLLERKVLPKAGELKWLQRYRRRWRVHIGRLPTVTILPLATRRAKA